MNTNLYKAKKAKNDEFYTRYEDIEKELAHYSEHFRDKIVYCNCDNPEHSNFWKYFVDNFEVLGLKKLIATYYNGDGNSKVTIYEGITNISVKEYGYNEWNNVSSNTYEIDLKGNGDFRSQECVDILKESDIIVTNPPFSLFREYVAQLMEYDKKFLIVGSDNAITYKDFFPLLKDNQVWKGVTHPKEFIQPDGSTKKFGNISWFTNLEHSKRNKFIPLTKHYTPEEYPKYDNYDAIHIKKTNDIPCDYDGVMGVPISFLNKFNPNQFEIIGIACGNSWANYKSILLQLKFNPNIKYGGGLGTGVVNGKATYARILIKRK